MADRVLLTDAIVKKLPFEPGDRKVVRDTEVPGFYLIIGKRRKTYRIQVDVSTGGSRKTVGETIGHAGHMTAKEARDRARRRILDLRHGGVDPSDGPTLTQGWERYLQVCVNKGLSPNTIEGYRHWVEYHLADWADTPLRYITPTMAIERFNAISATLKNGKPEHTTANRVMEILRAIYNNASKEHRKILPIADNPTAAIPWHGKQRRQTGMGVQDLAEWYKALMDRVHNPIRRSLHLLTLLTGSRTEAIRSLPWKDVHLAERVVYFRKVKRTGGEERAFWAPLSAPMIAYLEQVREAGQLLFPVQSKIWVFPSDSSVGHITMSRERKTVLPKYGNHLRQTYRNMGRLAGVDKLTVMQLMNHRIPGDDDVQLKPDSRDVSDGYLTETVHVLGDDLRAAQEKISSFIMDALQK